ncbi:hypothetical protein JAAARDRAFT_50409 [Jaapia argillacea MUCL 33604]|uniref:Uncharacterized protein n=1 Tax=Jaapia argillacea MUCL 33604 TaxID=933084 RepID=A0A067PB33_9AGAM|nr:hypothetical protein JAAARDRAFT_50409 [Jaapia argillacea MUCL 33604]
MARTKQTTTKSTGGTAAKKTILGSKFAGPVAGKAGRKSRSRSPNPLVKIAESWCCLCSNGGISVDCDRCDHTICVECVPGLGAIPTQDMANILFVCLSCHNKDEEMRDHPYMGVYRLSAGNGPLVPYQKEPLQVEAHHVFKIGNRFSTDPLAIIIFALNGIPI